MASRLRRSLMRVKDLCRKDRHRYLNEQYQRLRSVLKGHYAYYGTQSTFRSLANFYEGVRRLWKKWLSRRGRKGYVTWEKLEEIFRKYPLPLSRVTHGRLGTIAIIRMGKSQLTLVYNFEENINHG